MSSIPLGRACGLCGEQVILTIDTQRGEFTDDLTAVFKSEPGTQLKVKAHCGCRTPRRALFKALR